MSCALAENALLQEDVYINATEKDVDIHQHLVRSPPPQFPQNLSHFMYIQANSPKRQINQTKVSNFYFIKISILQNKVLNLYVAITKNKISKKFTCGMSF